MNKRKLSDIAISFAIFAAWSALLFAIDAQTQMTDVLVKRLASALAKTGWFGNLIPATTPGGVFTSPSFVTAAWFVYAIQMLPPVIAIVLLIHARRPPGDNETRCRKCNYILRGITKPRCPECGEEI